MKLFLAVSRRALFVPLVQVFSTASFIYAAISSVVLCVRNEGKYSKVLAQALQVMLWENRQHDMQRAAAFLKRLSTVSLHLGPAECMAGMDLKLHQVTG